jgi:Dolichyl-phosphate-mannose-protein mannosyltransferase
MDPSTSRHPSQTGSKILLYLPTPRAAGALALIGTLLAACLHVIFAFRAGSLWRDEVNTLNLATVPTFSEMWANLDYDSIPALFLFVLRLFAGVPADVSDSALRLFGVVIGLLVVAALWFNARQFRIGAPLVSLALVGFNPMVIRYGDSVRAYGLGTLLILLTIGTFWRVLESPARGRVAAAAFAAVLSVQCLYYNAVLLFAICLGAVAVSVRRREWHTAAIVFGIGAVAALSILPYLSVIRRVSVWNFQFKAAIDYTFLWGKLSETLASPLSGARWVWVGLFGLAVLAGVWRQFRKAESNEPRDARDPALFALVAMLVGVLGYAVFLRVLGYATQPWYYVLVIAFVATCLEIIFASFSRRIWPLLGRSALAAGLIGSAFLPDWEALSVRQTNVDQIAQRLDSLATKEDLILINTWNYGIPFRRYYQGGALIATVPPIEDLRFHRCDLVKRQMMSPAPLAPVLHAIERTLRSGHTVWLIGGIRFVPPGREPLVTSPGRDGPHGWEGADFYRSWSEQAGFLVQQHALTLERVQVPVGQPVSPYENLPLVAIRGWRSDARVSTR